MGFPTLLYERMRRTKGTRVFVVRDLFALGTIVVTSLIGIGIHFTKSADKFQEALTNGYFDNSPEYEQKRMYLQSMVIPTASEKLHEHEERDKNFMDGIIRLRELF